MEAIIKVFNEKDIDHDSEGDSNTLYYRKVFAEICSVGSNEFYKAAVNGLKASRVFKVFYADYKEEDMVQFGGKCYAVYRTYYDEKTDLYELYCNEVSI
ncbi:phage head closure protein [Dielma fastidiosa]|uniref:SPP1 family predicted phage head-tail adaptor n=1 Tax=Dielma fastidiosa TaxID=1034346 RepID=A0A318KJK7_9FIRM|nr:phage head closure protein [Dielma fastidiosa]PXX74652.1 SPP1 family predicted phage head-tail adaptor [Dielma fastidiosa]